MSAVMDAVADATASVSRLYPMGAVPKPPVYPYGAYSATLGRGDTHTLDGDEGIRWGRITLQAFGHTSDAALDLAEQARSALVGRALPIAGLDTTPVYAELDPVVVDSETDSGVVGVTATFNFTATPLLTLEETS